MSDAVLNAELRPERGSRPAGRLRRAGRVPAVVYGRGDDPVAVAVDARDLQHILSGAAGANTLITLQVDGAGQLTLARQIQRDPIRGDVVHVDFIRISADETVTAEIPLSLVGTAEGVNMGGMLEQQIFTLSIEAKPGDLPNVIEHDISALEVGDQVHVRDLAIPAGVTVLQEADEVVAAVSIPRAMAAEGEAAEGEAAEGEAAEGGAATDEGGESEG
ncbi:MAG TPA: 50S ribosomal protein L25 [Acidimicrobiia bacterium]|nr:50S ribosomal protein L25 [Acidimicrobiia bacterium]